MREEFGDPTEVSTDDPVQGPKSSDDAHRGTHYFSLNPNSKTAHAMYAGQIAFHIIHSHYTGR